ncbi:MAG: hypothetical protein ACREXX_13180 [Gammaproteobacteria bacterium]
MYLLSLIASRDASFEGRDSIRARNAALLPGGEDLTGRDELSAESLIFELSEQRCISLLDRPGRVERGARQIIALAPWAGPGARRILRRLDGAHRPGKVDEPVLSYLDDAVGDQPGDTRAVNA